MKQITAHKFFIPGFAAAVFIVVALILIVFRGGIPDDAVAVVDGEKISLSAFNSALLSTSAQTAGEGGKVVTPDPPNFTKCIAGKKAEEKSKKSSDSTLKNQCKRAWEDSKKQIMTNLVQQKWYELEAADRGVSVKPEEVKAQFDQIKSQSFPKDDDFKKFLRDYKLTEKALLDNVRISMLKQKVDQQVQTAPTPSTGQIKKEYEKSKKTYSTAASRDLLLVFNSSRSKVEAAKKAIDGGQSWKVVSKRYSQDSVSKANGGKYPGATKGKFAKQMDKAVFEAKKGELVGPISTQYGYYIFSVEKIVAFKQQTLAEATEAIRSSLQQKTLTNRQSEFEKTFEEKWRGKTKCAEVYKIGELCKNAKKPKGATAKTGAAG